MSGLADCSKPATSGAIHCARCQCVLTQTHQYVYADAPIPPGSGAVSFRVLDGPFCDDCANRRRAK